MSHLEPEIIDASSVPVRIYRLRWKFEFAGGKRPRTGVWDGISSNPIDSAWAVDKTGLLRVLIEGEDRLFGVGNLVTLLDVPGQDYASMQWEAYSKIPAFAKVDSFSVRGTVAGLSIITASEKLTAWVDGTKSREALGAYQASFNIHEHNLGK